MRKSMIHLKLLLSSFQALDAGVLASTLILEVIKGSVPQNALLLVLLIGVSLEGTEISSYCSTSGLKDP